MMLTGMSVCITLKLDNNREIITVLNRKTYDKMSTSLSSLIHYTLTCGRAIIIKSLPFVSPGAPPSPRAALNITALPLHIPAANYQQTSGCVITVTSTLRKRLRV